MKDEHIAFTLRNRVGQLTLGFMIMAVSLLFMSLPLLTGKEQTEGLAVAGAIAFCISFFYVWINRSDRPFLIATKEGIISNRLFKFATPWSNIEEFGHTTNRRYRLPSNDELFVVVYDTDNISYQGILGQIFYHIPIKITRSLGHTFRYPITLQVYPEESQEALEHLDQLNSLLLGMDDQRSS